MNNFNEFKQFSETDIRPAKFDDEHNRVTLEDINMLQSKKNEFVTSNCPACNLDDSTNEFLKNGFKV